MKTKKIFALSISIFSLILNSCGQTIYNACLETSDTQMIKENFCYQIDRGDVISTFYVIAKTMEESGENKRYDIVWKDSFNLGLFSLTKSLKGKEIISITKQNEHCLKVELTHFVFDEQATCGYLKINPSAFTINNPNIKYLPIYVYLAIGQENTMIEKPLDAYTN